MRDVFIIDGTRTPFLKAGAKPNPLPAADLAIAAAKPLLARQPFAASDIGEVIVGCVGPSAAEVNIGRIIALRAGCGDHVPGWTVQRNCASGLQALDCAALDIATGRYDLVMAGGTEAMSRSAVLYNYNMVGWLGEFRTAKTIPHKLAMLLKLRPSFLVPEFSLLKALTDPVVNLNMGQTGEKVAYEFGITRKQMDEFAVQSHLKAEAGYKEGHFKDELVPLFDWKGDVFEKDNGIRPDSTIEKLATLKPAFDKPFGLVTAGNSSQITDGASLLILASQTAIDKHKLEPIARIVDVAWSALDPSIMGMGPAFAIAALLKKTNISINDIDFFEINEAFASQVLACIKVLDDPDYCRKNFGYQGAVGKLDLAKLNIDGGAIAVGHPVGASGARLALHMAYTLSRTNKKLGIVSLCIGGGQGGAMLIENVAGGK